LANIALVAAARNAARSGACYGLIGYPPEVQRDGQPVAEQTLQLSTK
jgi:hypothetical protein